MASKKTKVFPTKSFIDGNIVTYDVNTMKLFLHKISFPLGDCQDLVILWLIDFS